VLLAAAHAAFELVDRGRLVAGRREGRDDAERRLPAGLTIVIPALPAPPVRRPARKRRLRECWR
jgi:hypothetical protein